MREQEDRTQLKHSTLFANCRKFHAIKAPLSMWIILTLISPCCLAQDSQDSTSSTHSTHSSAVGGLRSTQLHDGNQFVSGNLKK